MSLHDQFGTNAEKEINGVPFEFAPNPDGTIPTVVLARMGKTNKVYSKALEKATRPYRRGGEMRIAPEIAERLFQQVFIRTIMKSWSNIQLPKLDAEGKPVKENGKLVMEDVGELTEQTANMVFERLPYWYDDLQELAKEASGFQDDALEDEAKN